MRVSFRTMIITIIYFLSCFFARQVASGGSSSSSTTAGISPIVLNKLSINSSALSITSFRFNPSTTAVSPWVDRLLGERAVFWDVSDSNDTNVRDYNLPFHAFKGYRSKVHDKLFHRHHDKPLPVNGEELRQIEQDRDDETLENFSEALKTSMCSVEMLGYALLDVDHPFMISDKNQVPSVGFATVSISHTYSSSTPSHLTSKTSDTSAIKLQCFYRGSYDNWRKSELAHLKPHYWPVLIYCPSYFSSFSSLLSSSSSPPSFSGKSGKNDDNSTFNKHTLTPTSWDEQEKLCQSIADFHQLTPTNSEATAATTTHLRRRHYRSLRKGAFAGGSNKSHQQLPQPLVVHSEVNLQLQNSIWTTAIETIRNDYYFNHTFQQEEGNKPVVCTAIPYTAISKEKSAAMNAIFFEWIRYYSILGFKVIVYDREGWNYQSLFHSPYSTQSRSRSHNDKTQGNHNKKMWDIIHDSLIYHNYTILSTLAADMMKDLVSYDNKDGLSDSNIYKYDDDHTLSLTHCRFESLARYGYHRVLINDFDEFLYCRVGGSQLQTQKAFIHQYLDLLFNKGYDQIGFLQRIVKQRSVITSSSRNETIEECVMREVQEAKQLHRDKESSIFNCYSSYDNLMIKDKMKSIHFGLSCPVTTDHAACALITPEIRNYDCLCTSTVAAHCSLVHLSMRQSDFMGNTRRNKRYHSSNMGSSSVSDKLEISRILSDF